MSAKAISVLIVSFFVVCSFAPMLADADAETNDTMEKSVLIDFEKSDYKDKVQKVTKYPIVLILDGFGVHQPSFGNGGPYENHFNVDATMTNVTYSYGHKGSWNGTTSVTDTVSIIDTEFKIVLTAKSDVSLTVDPDHYILGSEYKTFTELLGNKLTAGQSVEFSGKIISEKHSVMETEVYKSLSLGGFIPKGAKIIETQYIDLDGKVKIGDTVCGYQYYTKSKMAITYTYDYGKDIEQVKIGDEYTMSSHADLQKTDFSVKVDVGAGFKDAKYDVDKLKEDAKDPEPMKVKLSEYNIRTEAEIIEEMNQVVQVNLVDELEGKSADEIKKAFDAVGGKYLLDDSNAYNDKVNKIENDVTGGSDNTVMIAIIVIVIIIIIALVALWYFKFRPQQAAQPNQPQQPEQPQQ